MDLQVISRLYISTRNGEREIQLCIGDITKVKEPVDVILVSAFPNDYATFRTSVIGALKANLNISVAKIAIHHKKEDLRSSLNCWISKVLTNGPYRQLICYETIKVVKGHEDLRESVEGIFRAMMPAFNNELKTVITPLIATGFQGASKSDVVKVMVENATSWMQMGLPLKRLQIVVYATSSDSLNQDDIDCIAAFNKMKNKLEKSPKSIYSLDVTVKDEVYLIYNSKDKDQAMFVATSMQKSAKKLQMITGGDIQKTDTWKHDVFVKMLPCARIVPFLSDNFLMDSHCVDEFTIALCCSRFVTSRHILAPVCLEQFTVPAFMSMVQWLNCKPRDYAKMLQAATLLTESIKMDGEKKKDKYDVFISYSHKNINQAKHLLNTLQSANPKLQIFFDYDQLKTGVTWQQVLYRALDNSSVVVSLLTPDYLTSAMCAEELLLAYANSRSKVKQCELIPFVLEDDFAMPKYLKDFEVKPVEKNIKTMFRDLCSKLSQVNGDDLTTVTQLKNPMDFEQFAENRRKEDFKQKYTLDKGTIKLTRPEPSKQFSSEEQKALHMFLSFSLRDQAFTGALEKLLKQKVPNVKFFHDDKMSMDDTVSLLKADCIVILLSANYVKSEKQMEELHLVICNERSTRQKNCYFIQLSQFPDRPSFVRLISYDVSTIDDLWAGLGTELSSADKEIVDLLMESHQVKLTSADLWSLKKAACDIDHFVTYGSFPSQSIPEVNVFINSGQVAELSSEVVAYNSLLASTTTVEGGQHGEYYTSNQSVHNGQTHNTTSDHWNLEQGPSDVSNQKNSSEKGTHQQSSSEEYQMSSSEKDQNVDTNKNRTTHVNGKGDSKMHVSAVTLSQNKSPEYTKSKKVCRII